MAAEGYPATSGEALRAEVERRAARLRESSDEVDPADLRRLQLYEIGAATADLTCGPTLYPIVERVHSEYLQRYLDGG